MLELFLVVYYFITLDLLYQPTLKFFQSFPCFKFLNLVILSPYLKMKVKTAFVLQTTENFLKIKISPV